ncbi:MAG: lipoprotein signal peptidase [Cyclobacteriaceae bacterium]|nr:lipoprotein signal peptidase [Cyclobacteriaceae bacterium]
MKKKNPVSVYFLISLLVIVLDQVVKMLVHFYMEKGTGGQILIFGEFFKLHYLTNPGMAFGMVLPFENAKVILTVFRLLAMVGIGYYLTLIYKKGATHGLLICIGMILGGAVGNLIDSIFYGVFLENNAPYDAPSPWFYGQVIDMFYIDIWEGWLPEWIPVIGGDHMALWPVFNVADASIFLGITIILIWQRSFFQEKEVAQEEPEAISQE